MHKQSTMVYLLLAAGVVIVSTAAILIRLAQSAGASSLTIAAVRLGIAALVLSPFVLIRQRESLRALSRRDLGRALLAGVALALHFGCWISSLATTSVAASTILVTTNPLWVGLASVLIWRERLSWQVLAGLALTLAGTFWIFALTPAPSSVTPNSVLGNTLALAGAFTMSAYLLLGRSLRRRLLLLTYVWLVYSIAALLLLIATVATGETFTSLSPQAVICMIALALGPQLLGHTIFNWALRHLSATFISLSILGEPIGAALLAWVLFGETLNALQIAACALILSGIVLAALADGNRVAKMGKINNDGSASRV